MHKTKHTIRLADISTHPLSKGAPTGHLRLRGLLGSPLLDSTKNYIGQVLVTDKKDGSDFNETDEELLVALCAQVAIGIEKAEAYTQEHTIAEALQQAILAVPEDLPGLEIGSTYESAGEVAKVGGDFYDLFELGCSKTGIVIGDVSGKGLKAATITSMVKSTVRAFAYTGLTPAAVLTETNRVVCKQLGLNQFITMLFGVLDQKTGVITVCRAGHPEMIVWKQPVCTFGQAESNLPLGIFEEVTYVEDEIKVNKGEGLILYTDGLTEARSDKRILGEDGLIEVVNSIASDNSAQQVARDLVSLAREYNGGKQQDDIAVIVIRLVY